MRVLFDRFIAFFFFVILVGAFSPSLRAQDVETSTTTAVREIETQISSLFTRISRTMAVTGLSARSLSTYHIGNFPHFSFSIASSAGIYMDNVVASLSNFVGNVNNAVGEEIKFFEIIPGISAATPFGLRIGGFGIPFDLGLHFMYIPFTIGSWKIDVTTLSAGADARFVVLEEHVRRPGVSIGLSYFHQKLHLGSNIGTVSLPATSVAGNELRIQVDNMGFGLDFGSHSIGLPIQVSKKLKFFEPHFGLEPYFSILQLKTQITGALGVSLDNGDTYEKYQDYIDRASDYINSTLISDGKINNQSYTQEKYDGGLRIFSGFSFIIGKLWYLNFELSYDPVVNVLSSTISNRFVF